jgi:hypothetical protein
VVRSATMGTVTRIVPGARPAAAVALLIVVMAVGVAACGGTSATHRSTTPVTFATYRTCLKEHGVGPLFAGGRFDTLASRIGNPRYTAVVKECGVARRPPLSAQTTALLGSYTACVARHGYRLPAPDTTGRGPVFPAGTDQIARYRTAAAGCASITRAIVRSIDRTT